MEWTFLHPPPVHNERCGHQRPEWKFLLPVRNQNVESPSLTLKKTLVQLLCKQIGHI